jgi:Tat protein secretion system quality control protein TatD with DNase activity
MNTSFKEMLEYIPLEGFFLETDSEYSLNIEERYAIMAHLKNTEINYLQAIMIQNLTDFFEWKKDNFEAFFK